VSNASRSGRGNANGDVGRVVVVVIDCFVIVGGVEGIPGGGVKERLSRFLGL
jgi:hypothetical protein